MWELWSQAKCDHILHAHTRGIPILVAVMVNHTMSSVGVAETDREIKSESVKMAVYYITVDKTTHSEV